MKIIQEEICMCARVRSRAEEKNAYGISQRCRCFSGTFFLIASVEYANSEFGSYPIYFLGNITMLDTWHLWKGGDDLFPLHMVNGLCVEIL